MALREERSCPEHGHEHSHDRTPVHGGEPRSRVGRGRRRGLAGRHHRGHRAPGGSAAGPAGLPRRLALSSHLHGPIRRRPGVGDPPPSQRDQPQGNAIARRAGRRGRRRRVAYRPHRLVDGGGAAAVHRPRLHRGGAGLRSRLRAPELPAARRHDAPDDALAPGRRLRSRASQPLRLWPRIFPRGDQRGAARRRSLPGAGLPSRHQRPRQRQPRHPHPGHRSRQRPCCRRPARPGARRRSRLRPPVDAAPRHRRRPRRFGAPPGGARLHRHDRARPSLGGEPVGRPLCRQP